MSATVSSDSPQRLLSLYRTMARIRAFENAAEEASKGGVAAFGASLAGLALVRGPLHLSTGQEAIAAGAAQAIKHRGGREIVACFFGDGAINRGPFLEGLNWTAIYRLPVLLVCEDNRYSATTATEAMTAGEGAAARARAIGIAARVVDGNDVEAVAAAAAALVAEVRDGVGPRFLHAVTYRVKGHVSVDAAGYRAAAEVSEALEQDPLRIAAEKLAARGASTAEIDRIRAEAESEIAAAVAAAHAAPWPEAQVAYGDVQATGADRWF